MIQPAHRGIYEFLWFEQKNSILAVSLKAFQGIATKLGKRPMLIALLKKFADHAYDKQSENYNALLNAYDEVKNVLSRSERQFFAETMLRDESEAAKLIYELPLKHGEKVLSGCRLFFPREQGLYKFWDVQDKPGLWACFGAFQLHLTPQQVFSKIVIASNSEANEVLAKLKVLEKGISYEEYNSYPEALKVALQRHLMVAIPGKKSAWLNPRIDVESLTAESSSLALDQLEVSALALEKIWDEAEYMPDVIAKAPDEADFKKVFSSSALPYVIWKDSFNADEALEELKERYTERLALDNGCLSSL